ncbi:hypothetical protein LTR84_012015 [Exophiala bonariae]|uniref:SnoaL-like domain-containing protein n=1 Tax=Exophiala bonariae TaxID=1690606 RepID=A0AAV9MUH7_9EURO|nr:hypothetical protein LTR84_012015 [Exophiala bonariae]
MNSNSNNVADVWATSGIPQKQQAFLKRYFEVLDAEPEKGAQEWANSFAEGGRFVNGTMVIENSNGMPDSQRILKTSPLINNKQDLEHERHKYWKAWPHLYHVVKRIYVLPRAEHSDFVVIGNWAIKRPDGSTLQRDTAARFHLVDQEGDLKIREMEVYAVGVPIPTWAAVQ